jgi:hypothetical protein
MPIKSDNTMDQLVSDARRNKQARENTYRERALKLFSWICGRCGREFSGKQLNQLTVHHKDHNHENNPSDGSNWELLCIYCHENEHARGQVADAYAAETPDSAPVRELDHRPFADLELLLKARTEKNEERDKKKRK